jgi:hypothetical protein
LGSRVGMDAFGKKALLRAGIRTPDLPTRSLVAIPTALLRLPQCFAKLGIFFLQMVSNGNTQHTHISIMPVTSVTTVATWC